MSVFIALALAAGANDLPPAEPIPTFDGAQQKWACRFESFTSHETVTGYFGVYRTRVDDEFTGDHTIVQNDAKAVVFVESDVGVVHDDGKVIQSVVVTIIEKTGSHRFKRSGVELDGNPVERTGTCAPY